ncbi:hypothetical protein ACHAXT_001992 [Thalassiosira profunda]
MASNDGGFPDRARRDDPPSPRRVPSGDSGDGSRSHRSGSTHSSRGSASTSRSDGSLAVVIGKTFEATTLPDGSHQILELTKYRRLRDGAVYHERKLRSLDDGRDDFDEREGSGRSLRRAGAGSESSSSSIIVPPSSLGGRSGRLTLGRLSLGRSPKDNKRSGTDHGAADDFGGDVAKDYGDYPDVLSTFSSSGSFSVAEEGAPAASVATEDHCGPTEDHPYDADLGLGGFQSWRDQRSRRLAHRQGQWGVAPHSSASLGSIKEHIGWCAAWDENSPTSLRLAPANDNGRWGGVWAPTRRAAAMVRSFFPATPSERAGRVVDPNAALDVNCGKRRSENDGEDEERGAAAPSGGRGCKERLRTRRCQGAIAAALLVLIGTVVAAAVLAPSRQSDPARQVDGDGTEDAGPPPCVHVKVVVRAPATGDANAWTLERTNPDGRVVEVASASSLPDLGEGESHEYKKCVQPGVYDFRISDSGGDGLGEEGNGGYYITADGATLGVSSFFFHEERMTFALPFDADGDGEDKACADDFFLAVKTDDNPKETRWTVVDDATGEAVLEGGPYELPQAVHTRRACLPDGEYTFRMTDEGADGLCCEEGKGFFVLSREGETIATSNGEFGERKEVSFAVGDGAEK